jgi:hypothetical protein
VTKEVKTEEKGPGSVRETVTYWRAGKRILVREKQTNPKTSTVRFVSTQQVFIEGKLLMAMSKTNLGIGISSVGRDGLFWSMGDDKRTGEAKLMITRTGTLEVVELFNITKEGFVPVTDDELRKYSSYMGEMGKTVEKMKEAKGEEEIKEQILRVQSLSKEYQKEQKP